MTQLKYGAIFPVSWFFNRGLFSFMFYHHLFVRVFSFLQELAFGWGKALEQALRILLEKRGLPKTQIDPEVVKLMAECLSPPLKEIRLPRDL